MRQVETKQGSTSPVDNSASTKGLEVNEKKVKEKGLSIKLRFENFILSRFYGTERFHLAFKKDIDKWVEQQLVYFDALSPSVFDVETLAKLRGPVTHHIKQIAGLTIWWDSIASFIIQSLITEVFQRLYFFIAAGAIISAAIPKGHIPMWYWFYLIALNIVVLYVNLLFSKIANSATDNLRITAKMAANAAQIIIYGYFTYVIIHAERHKYSAFLAATLSGAQQGFYYGLIDLGGSLTLLLSAFFFIRWRNSKYPDSVVIHDLVMLLSGLVHAPERWTKLDYKRLVVNTMEEVATCFDRYLPVRLSCRNPGIMLWQRQMFSQIATAVRESMRWILMPKLDSRTALIERLKSFLYHSTVGDWDALERLDPDKAPATPNIGQRILTSVRVVTMASIVPLAAWGFHVMEPAQHIPTAITAIVIAWPIVTLLTALDPDIKSKIETFRSAFQIIQGNSEKK